MCGICGKLNFDSQQPVAPGLIRKMMDVILHRGPDGGGEYVSGPVGLGHRRLSIIDVATGHQPMANEDDTVWVVYNGEIYNFQELRAELIAKGHQFKSYSDTEVIIHAYEEYGDEFVIRLRGMFAFALWDCKRQRLFLARDRVGVKPLYFANTGKALIFGSEIKSILIDDAIERRINPAVLDRFLTYYYAPGNETLFAGIYKLDPGHYLTVENGKVLIKQYWDLGFEAKQQTQDFDSAVTELRELLLETVEDHMISDVPVGVLLSGGVDSTGILNYAVQSTTQPIHTFTMGFSGEGFHDERPYAKLAAEKFGTIHRDISMGADDFRDFLPKYVWHMEEPVCEPPAVALYFVSKLAQQHGVKVLLSGEGGDEAFAGYQTYRNLLMLEKLKTLPEPLKSLVRIGFQTLGKKGYKSFKNYASLMDLGLKDYYFSRTATPFTPFNRLKPELYKPAFAEQASKMQPHQVTQNLFEKVSACSQLNQMLYIDSKSWLPDDLLVKADKMSMAASVELRVPLLDFRVLEFAASLPQEYKVKGWQLKRILKKALENAVPKEILERKKTGFPVPYETWMRREIKDFVVDTISANNSASENYFNRATVAKILRDFQENKGYAKEVFSLLVLELWHKQFIQKT